MKIFIERSSWQRIDDENIYV